MNSERKTNTQKRRDRRKRQKELENKKKELEEKFNLEIKQEKGKIDIIFSVPPKSILRIIYQIASEFYSFEKRLCFFVKHIYSNRYALQIEDLNSDFWLRSPIEIDEDILQILQESLDKRYSLEKCDFQSCRKLVYNDNSSIVFRTCEDCSLDELEEAFLYYSIKTICNSK